MAIGSADYETFAWWLVRHLAMEGERDPARLHDVRWSNCCPRPTGAKRADRVAVPSNAFAAKLLTAEREDDQMPSENLSELLGRVSENSTSQIDDLVGDFGRLREKLRTDGERIQREIEEYSRLSEQVMQLTKTISGSVEKVRASVDPQEKE